MENDEIKRLRKILPSQDVVRACYEELVTQFTEKEISVDDLKTEIAAVRQKLGGAIFRGSQERKIEQWYWRVRNGDFDINTIAEFSHPPAATTKMGRCNLRGNPVFYASEALPIALDEAEVGQGDIAFVSLWRSRRNFPKYALIMGASNANSPRLQHHYETRLSKIIADIQSYPPDIADSMMAIAEVSEDMFRRPERHELSAMFSHDILYNSDCDGIEYPDAKTGTVYNFALTAEFAQRLELHRVYKVERRNKGVIAFCEIGTPVSTTHVEWKKVESNDPMLPENDPEVQLTELRGENFGVRRG